MFPKGIFHSFIYFNYFREIIHPSKNELSRNIQFEFEYEKKKIEE
jgi:hypothetical protein